MPRIGAGFPDAIFRNGNQIDRVYWNTKLVWAGILELSFSTPGRYLITLPEGINVVSFDLAGASGQDGETRTEGGAGGAGGTRGLGGRLTGSMPAEEGERLLVAVGGAPTGLEDPVGDTNQGGMIGGGWGGALNYLAGSSISETPGARGGGGGGLTYLKKEWILKAAAGGGGGGGAGGQDLNGPIIGPTPYLGGNGGHGGHDGSGVGSGTAQIGGDGEPTGSGSSGGKAGGAGTSSAGGAAGAFGVGSLTFTQNRNSTQGEFLSGGGGGGFRPDSSSTGGGGGAGYYGGGGGGCGSSFGGTGLIDAAGGGGGGGSNLADSDLLDVVHARGFNDGDGYATLILRGSFSDLSEELFVSWP